MDGVNHFDILWPNTLSDIELPAIGSKVKNLLYIVRIKADTTSQAVA